MKQQYLEQELLGKRGITKGIIEKIRIYMESQRALAEFPDYCVGVEWDSDEGKDIVRFHLYDEEGEEAYFFLFDTHGEHVADFEKAY